jgi:hypothetical protein
MYSRVFIWFILFFLQKSIIFGRFLNVAVKISFGITEFEIKYVIS